MSPILTIHSSHILTPPLVVHHLCYLNFSVSPLLPVVLNLQPSQRPSPQISSVPASNFSSVQLPQPPRALAPPHLKHLPLSFAI